MSILKKSLLFIIITILLVMICSGVLYAADTTISSNACSVRYWDEPTSIPENLRYIWNIEAKFYANRLTVNYGALKTEANRNIKQSRVRLYETLNGVPAGKSSQKDSAIAPSKTYSTVITNKLTMWDSLDWNLKTNVDWRWFYF